MKLFESNKINSVVWTVRITDNEYQIHDRDEFGVNIDNALTAVDMGEEEFVVLSPSVPIKNYKFLQACPDNASGYLHIELGLNEKNSKGFPKILCKDRVEIGEVLDTFESFYRNHSVDTEGWYEL